MDILANAAVEYHQLQREVGSLREKCDILTTENNNHQEKVARLILENEDLKRQLGLYSAKKKKGQKENRKCDVLDLDLMKRKIKYYTGFDNERYNMVKKNSYQIQMTHLCVTVERQMQ